MPGREMGAADHGLLIDRRAQDLGKARGLHEGIAGDDLAAGEDHRPLGRQQPERQPAQRRIRRPPRGVDPGRLAEVERREIVQDVARQRDEHRPRRRRQRDLGGAVDDARQVGEARDLGRPLHDRGRDRHQRRVEQGLHQPVPLLLLPGGDDQRRAGDMGGVQRADRIAEPGGHVHVAGREPARGARVAIGHGDHDRLLQAEHIADLRVVGQRVHDRQLGGPGVAEHLRDPFGLQQLDEGALAADLVGRQAVGHEGSEISLATMMARTGSAVQADRCGCDLMGGRGRDRAWKNF